MRRIFFLTFFLGLNFIHAAIASELAAEGTSERKFQRGLLNIAFAPVEITDAWVKSQSKDTLIPTWATEGIHGTIGAGIRMVTGIYEVITAPIPSPPRYQPIYHPEFAMEKLGYDHHLTLRETTK